RDRNVTGVQTCALPIYINAEKVINSYFQICTSKALVEPVRIPLISAFEQNAIDIEIKIGKLVVNKIESLGKGIQAQTYRELRYFSLFGLGKDTMEEDRKSTRLNSSHVSISYAVFCLKKTINNL